MLVQLFGRCGPEVEQGTQASAKSIAAVLGTLSLVGSAAYALGMSESLAAHKWRALPLLLIGTPALAWGLQKHEVETPKGDPSSDGARVQELEELNRQQGEELTQLNERLATLQAELDSLSEEKTQRVEELQKEIETLQKEAEALKEKSKRVGELTARVEGLEQTLAEEREVRKELEGVKEKQLVVAKEKDELQKQLEAEAKRLAEAAEKVKKSQKVEKGKEETVEHAGAWVTPSIHEACRREVKSWSVRLFKAVCTDLHEMCRSASNAYNNEWQNLPYSEREKAQQACQMLWEIPDYVPEGFIGHGAKKSLKEHGVEICWFQRQYLHGYPETNAPDYMEIRHQNSLVITLLRSAFQRAGFNGWINKGYADADNLAEEGRAYSRFSWEKEHPKLLEARTKREEATKAYSEKSQALVLVDEDVEAPEERMSSELDRLHGLLYAKEWSAAERELAFKHIEENVEGELHPHISQLAEEKHEFAVRFLLTLYLDVRTEMTKAMKKALDRNLKRGSGSIKFDGTPVFSIKVQSEGVPTVTLAQLKSTLDLSDQERVVVKTSQGNRTFDVPPVVMFNYLHSYALNLHWQAEVNKFQDGRMGIVMIPVKLAEQQEKLSALGNSGSSGSSSMQIVEVED